MIQLKRVYDPPSPADGTRFLIERLWPRGIANRSKYGNADQRRPDPQILSAFVGVHPRPVFIAPEIS